MMASISTTEICNTIVNTLREIDSLGSGVVQKPGELTEGINDEPTVQVYPEMHEQDPGGNTDRTGFGGGVRQTRITINVDLYARQRRYLGEDMAALCVLIDDITSKFEEQNRKPYLGLAGIKAFSWIGSRIMLTYGEPLVNYIGWRWALVIWVF